MARIFSLRTNPGRLLAGAAFLFLSLWTLLAWRAHGHYRAGAAFRSSGNILEAAREWQSAIGFYAPLNPWSGKAAEALRGMVQEVRLQDPALAVELEDRLRRSVRGLRWIVQPYADILLGPETSREGPPRDPDPWLFFLSLAGLAGGAGALLIPGRRASFRAAGFVAGLVLWALALHYC